MKRVFASALLTIILLPCIAMAQQQTTIPIFVGFSVKPLFADASYSVNGQDMSLRGRRTLGEFGLSFTSPYLFRAACYVGTGWTSRDEKTPIGSFVVGATEFGEKPTEGGGGGSASASQKKPIILDFKADPSIRLEFSGLFRPSRIQPLLVVRRIGLTLGATSTEDQPKHDSESYKEWFGALGGEYDFFTGNTRTSVKIAASGKLFFVSGAFDVALSRWARLGVGVYHESITLNKGIARVTAPWLNFAAEF